MQLILKLGAGREGTVNVMSRHLGTYWQNDPKRGLANIKEFQDVFVEFLTYGPYRSLFSSEIFTSNVVAESIQKEKELPKSITNDILEKDYLVRLEAINFLIQLDPKDLTQQAFANELLIHLLDLNWTPSLNGHHIFEASSEHRNKFRLWQVILLLEPYADNDLMADVVNRCYRILDEQNNLISIRYLIEWLITRALLKNPSLIPNFLSRVSKYSEKAQLICSHLSISYLVATSLREKSDQIKYLPLIIKALQPWPLTHLYAPRLMAMAVLLKIKRICSETDHLKNIFGNSLDYIQAFMENNEDCLNHIRRVEQEYFVAEFHPIRNYTLDFIFHYLLLFSGVPEDEIIPIRLFVSKNPNPPALIPFTQSNFQVRPEWSTRRIKEEEALKTWSNGRVVVTAQTSLEDSVENIQKKITPWDLLVQNDAEITRSTIQEKKRHDLVVIATLIDKLPNLGGICRTCEIFNANKLVVHDIKVREHPIFKNLSVSSEKWLPMEEVREPDLPRLISRLKDEGYTMLGVEQTANSKNLLEYKFPSKVALLLGREKEGIPVELIHLLDDCIEIPQFGVTRSLNVHVSGAILVYEFTKQLVSKDE